MRIKVGDLVYVKSKKEKGEVRKIRGWLFKQYGVDVYDWTYYYTSQKDLVVLDWNNQ